MGGDGGLRHVVHKRVHLERHQPKARKKLGYLEKHKDYVKRAKDFHQKEEKLQKLHRKAYFKNDDEFSFAMVNHFTSKDGKAMQKKSHLTKEQMQLAESQDARYILMREQMDKKAVEKRSETLQFLDADRPNKHVLFVDEDDDGAAGGSTSSSSQKRAKDKKGGLKDFDVAAHFDTHPSLLGRKANRPRLKQLETDNFLASGAHELAAKEAYHELLERQERAKKLGKVREELELRKNMRTKGRVKKVGEATKDKPAQFKWMYDRKR
eukprot:TRINITY_DN49796_c0_g1_i1.p1 TRINITY_DN49796_c0_g1~~TRINITY_DN49796_c0_g1_i1.p1  ORF type:complete len:288 (-),score=85.61 TRINITY_DN49796_c0_g1_i1:58-855(-)